ncbi:hypothetical protein [Eubacterium sp.]
MEELEVEKSELSIRIMKEEMSRPKLTREERLYWFYKFRKLNPKKLDHRRSLINNFVNSVFLYEDRMINYLQLQRQYRNHNFCRP